MKINSRKITCPFLLEYNEVLNLNTKLQIVAAKSLQPLYVSNVGSALNDILEQKTTVFEEESDPIGTDAKPAQSSNENELL